MVSTERRFGAAENKSAHTGGGSNLKKLEDSTEGTTFITRLFLVHTQRPLTFISAVLTSYPLPFRV